MHKPIICLEIEEVQVITQLSCVLSSGCIRHLKLYLEQIFSNTLSQLYKSNVNRKERRGPAYSPVRLNDSSNLTSFSLYYKKETDPFYLTFAAPFRGGPG